MILHGKSIRLCASAEMTASAITYTMHGCSTIGWSLIVYIFIYLKILISGYAVVNIWDRTQA